MLRTALPVLVACGHQVGVDKIKLRGKLRVTLPLFDELPCVAGIQVRMSESTSFAVLVSACAPSPLSAHALVCTRTMHLYGYADCVCGDAQVPL